MSQIVRPLQVNVVAAYYGGVFVGDLFGNAAIFSGLSGTAFGVVQGIGTGIGAGFFGGFVASGGNVKAALTGAVAGAFTGGVAGYYGSNYPLTRVASNAVASGVSAKIQGGNFIDGLKAGLVTSAFTYGNMYMRNNMIKNSLGLDNPEGQQPNHYLNDGTGQSSGMFGDLFHLAGVRLNDYAAKVGNFVGGPLGGRQNAPGTLFGMHYEQGGFVDMVLESFAEPHDMANSPHFYNIDGTGKDILGIRGKNLEYTTNYTTSLAFATPFAAAAIAEQSNYSAYRYIRR